VDKGAVSAVTTVDVLSVLGSQVSLGWVSHRLRSPPLIGYASYA
jgi:hypothetical protein